MYAYRSREDLNAWLRDAREERDREIQALIKCINASRVENQGRFTYDWDGNYLGFQIPPDVACDEEEESDMANSIRILVEKEEVQSECEDEILETLLNGELSVGIKVRTHEDVEETEEKEAKLPMIEEEASDEEVEHQSQPEVRVDDAEPPRSTRPREKARRRKRNRHRSRSQRWHQQTRRIRLVHNNSLHYLPRIQLDPGKFKYWWPDPFTDKDDWIEAWIVMNQR
ncbi:hypothetical protein R6Q57_003711 [Mikania cordata]